MQAVTLQASHFELRPTDSTAISTRRQALRLAIRRLPQVQQDRLRSCTKAVPADDTAHLAVPEVEYKDTLTDVAFIALCRKAYGSLAGELACQPTLHVLLTAGSALISATVTRLFRYCVRLAE